MRGSGEAVPEWMMRMRLLAPEERRERYERWLAPIRRPAELRGARVEQNLKRGLEQLQDAIAEARAAGVSSAAIGAVLALDPEIVEALSD